MNKICHIDLFSGIGGFALATEMVWGNVEHIFCENDDYCTKILQKHWPHATYFGDIRTLTADALRERYLHGQLEVEPAKPDEQAQREPLADLPTPFILTGGFPCQPFSQAGRRKGTADDRFLWPEMFRVIREFHPLWVIAENVRGIISIEQGMVFEQVCLDLESEGYAVQPLVIPAVAVNAPHRRDRVWFVAHDTRSGLERSGGSGKGYAHEDSDVADTNTERLHPGEPRRFGGRVCGQDGKVAQTTERGKKCLDGDSAANPEVPIGNGDSDASNAKRYGDRKTKRRINEKARRVEKENGTSLDSTREFIGTIRDGGREGYAEWNKNWSEVASALCDVSYGLPSGLVRPDGERDRNYPWWRKEALKAGGEQHSTPSRGGNNESDQRMPRFNTKNMTDITATNLEEGEHYWAQKRYAELLFAALDIKGFHPFKRARAFKVAETYRNFHRDCCEWANEPD